MIKAINCKTGSAWHAWQVEGAEWVIKTEAATEKAIENAATVFANVSGFPSAGIDARYRAFIEGVKLQLRDK